MAAWALGAIGDRTAIDPLSHAAQSDTGTDHEGRRVSDFALQAILEIQNRENAQQGST